jgi:hypothetical protein
MRVSENVANNFLRADDFDSKGSDLIMSSVEVETVGKEEKWVLYFKNSDKGLPLNKTNKLAIAEIHGDDTDDWDGKVIRVFRDKTQYEGKRVSCMRISESLASPTPGSGSPGLGTSTPKSKSKGADA